MGCTSRCTARRPDIAGQNKANPLGAIGSVAAMLEYSFGLKEEAAAVNAAIEAVLNSGRVTADLQPRRPAGHHRARWATAVAATATV